MFSSQNGKEEMEGGRKHTSPLIPLSGSYFGWREGLEVMLLF
jgi:hypothetical protein